MREFEADELKDYLETKPESPVLLDVRQPWEYDICNLDDSVLIPMSQIPVKLDQLEKDQETVVICHHGIRSRRVASFLEQAGFSNIINLKGGLDAWARTVDLNMATY
jgi:rhodanese-related sulfurtransferase